VASDVLKRAVCAGRISPNDFRVIHESNPFPSAALGYAHNLKPDLAAKLRGCCLNFDWKGTSLGQYFADAGQTRFAPADYKKDWDLVRRIDNEIGYAHRLPE
jgi:phosphonate transport system substrate-binding protein